MRRNAFHTNVYVRPLAYKMRGAHRREHRRPGCVRHRGAAFRRISAQQTRAFHAGVSSWRRIEDNAIPPRAKICGAYVNSALASDDARRSGFDEAILLNESGHVAEGATCNIFMVRKGKLITPPVTENVLEGITRDSVMRAGAQGAGHATSWSARSIAANSTCATNCSSPAPPWALRRSCASTIAR